MQHAQKNGQAAGWELISRYPGTPVECPSKLLCPSVCMYVRTQEQVNGFSWNLVLGGGGGGSLKFINMLNFSQNWITIINNNGHFVWRSTCISVLQSHSVRVPHAYRKPCIWNLQPFTRVNSQEDPTRGIPSQGSTSNSHKSNVKF
jgi:hypothetical protein